MLVLDGRMASLNRSLNASTVQTENVANAADSTELSETEDASEPHTASSDNVAEIQEGSNNLAESASSAAQESSAAAVSFDLGQSLSDTLDSGLRLINGIDSAESAQAASQELSKLTETLSGFVTLSQLLPESSQEAVTTLAKNASSSFSTAFAKANTYEGVETVLKVEQEKLLAALAGLE